jgi:hypothetical protein
MHEIVSLIIGAMGGAFIGMVVMAMMNMAKDN